MSKNTSGYGDMSGKEYKKFIKTLEAIKKDGHKRAAASVKLEKHDIGTSVLVAFFVFTIVAVVSWNILWRIGFLSPWPNYATDPNVNNGSLAFNLTILFWLHNILGLNTFRGYYWPAIAEWLAGSGLSSKFYLVNILPVFLGVLPAYIAGKDAGKGKPTEEHLSGRKLYERVEEAVVATKEEISVHGQGINIHPLVPISRDRETRHFFVLGAIGAGKTQVLRNILNSVIERLRKGPEDRLIIYDNKSDVTEGVPVDDSEMILLAPWDKRTWAWDVAKDVLNDADAAEVAGRLIPDSDDPFWANAARQVLISIFAKLQREKGTNWSWADVNKGIGDDVAMVKAIQAFNPTLAAPFKDPTSKAAQNIVVTLATFASTIRYLTQAWDNIDPVTGKEYEPGRVIQKISLREWALSPEVERRVIVLQGNKRYSVLEKAYVQAIISAFGGIMNSPEMTDSKSRRIWMFLDEFPQLGKLDNFAQYLEVGRSKGMCVLIGLQDLAQLREIYGKETADVWAAICGTYIVCRSQGVDTLDWLIKFFGRKVVKTWSKSVSKQGNSKSEQEKERDIVTSQDILGLGATKLGVKALLSLNDESGAYRLIWPYVTFKKRRPSQQPAAWTTSIPEMNLESTKASLTKALSELFAKGFEKGPHSSASLEEHSVDNSEYVEYEDEHDIRKSIDDSDSEEDITNFFELPPRRFSMQNPEPITRNKQPIGSGPRYMRSSAKTFEDAFSKHGIDDGITEKHEIEDENTVLDTSMNRPKKRRFGGLDDMVDEFDDPEGISTVSSKKYSSELDQKDEDNNIGQNSGEPRSGRPLSEIADNSYKESPKPKRTRGARKSSKRSDDTNKV